MKTTVAKAPRVVTPRTVKPVAKFDQPPAKTPREKRLQQSPYDVVAPGAAKEIGTAPKPPTKPQQRTVRPMKVTVKNRQKV